MGHEKFPPPAFGAIMRGLNYYDVTGIKADTAVSEEEFEAVLDVQTQPSTGATETAEEPRAKGDPPALAAKKQLQTQAMGRHPVSVIHGNTASGFQRIYDAGVSTGNGTEAEREEFREVVEFWWKNSTVLAKEILALSSVNRFRSTEKTGHNLQLLELELIAKEVRWVYSHLVRDEQD